MSPIDAYFDKIFCINMDRSQDRWTHVIQECQKHQIATVERFNGFDFNDYKALPYNLRKGMENAMYGCTASHGALLNLIAHNQWKKVLILEDDFEIFHDDFNDRFLELIPKVPKDWDLLYLGAHYGDYPLGRINKHVLKAGQIKTTSSYAITAKHARLVAPLMCGGSAPDDILSGFNPLSNAFVLQPRLMGQYENVSTIFGKLTNNSLCMQDGRHENSI